MPRSPVCGFFGLFEEDYGDPATPRPYPRVTPSYVGNSLLPFRCPHCREIPQALACPTTRRHYFDARAGRGSHWCPLCRKRFFIEESGMPLPCALPAGAVVGPSRVERAGQIEMQDAASLSSTILGWALGANRRDTLGLDVLGATTQGVRP